MYEIKTQQFTGPLDLLLRLIEEQKFEIENIFLAQVTEQFVESLDVIKEREPDLIPDFLSVAARLVLLKSRSLLPYLEEDDEADDLEKQLKIYKEFLEAGKRIGQIIGLENFAFSREKSVSPVEIKFAPPKNITAAMLAGAFQAALIKAAPIRSLPKVFVDRQVSMQEQILFLKNLVRRQKTIDFHREFLSAKNKTEVIINFLAALELLKSQCIEVKQGRAFSRITIQEV